MVEWKEVDGALVPFHGETRLVWAPQAGSQVDFLTSPIFETLLEGPRGTGKALRNDQLVLTPHGFKRIDALKVGDLVKCPDDTCVPITHVFERPEMETYRVTFSDGRSVVCCGEHKWKFRCIGKPRRNGLRWHLNDTTAVKGYLDKGWSVQMPLPCPLSFQSSRRGLSHYLLGLYLGDGSHTRGRSGNLDGVRIHSGDEETHQRLIDLGAAEHCNITLSLPKSEFPVLWKALKDFGLVGKRAESKAIPEVLLLGSIDDRTQLLQGLMDADGTAAQSSGCTFTSVSQELAEGVQFLVRSLGGKATLTGPHRSMCAGKEHLPHYDVYIQPGGRFEPFWLKRKRESLTPYMHKEMTIRVTEITPLGVADCRCIAIDHPDGLFVTNDFIVTHNTDVLLMDFAQHVGQGFGDAWSGILLRQTYRELDDVVQKSKRWFHQIFPAGSGNVATFNVSSYTWSWDSGERLSFRYLQSPADYDKYHGHCVRAGTKVLLDTMQYESIEKIKPYDWVWVPTGRYQGISMPVQYTTMEEYDGPMYTYRDRPLAVHIECTKDHDVCVLEEMSIRRCPFHELKEGDRLIMGDFRVVTFDPAKLETSHFTGKVYCLGIPIMHRFVAQQDGRAWMSGNSYPWIGFEELTTWPTSEMYRRMMSLCRGTAPGMPRKIRSTTNPNGVGHNWVKRRFQLPTLAGKTIGTIIRSEEERPRVAVHSSLEENKVLLHVDPDYVKNLRIAAKNENERAAWIDGSWDITSGGMFDDIWRSDEHVVDDIIGFIPSSWRIDRSFDWGSSSPASVGWWAESDGTELTLPDGTIRSTIRGDIYRVAEWYIWNNDPDNPRGLNMLAEDIARGILERELEWDIQHRTHPGPADNSIFDVENGVCIATDMRRRVKINTDVYKGVSWTRSDKRPGSRKQGWIQIRKYLQGARKPAILQKRENPGLFICRRCVDFIRTFPSLPRDPSNLDDIPTKNIEDHIADEARYRIRGKPPMRQGEVSGG